MKLETSATSTEDSDIHPSRCKIAIVHPTSWPYVRRGTERFLNEYASYLSRRGYSVKIICSKPGHREIVREGGYVTDYHRRLWNPALTKLGILEYHVFPLTTLMSLLVEQFDLVHCFNFTDALAAASVPRTRRAGVILHLNSVPPEVEYRRVLGTGGLLLRKAIYASDEVLCVSLFQQNYFERRFGRKTFHIPVPVDTVAFPLSLSRDHDRPTILCASALEDRRKGGRLLMRAFNRVKEARPEVRLQISSQVNEKLRATLLDLVVPKWRGDVHFLGVGDRSDLPGLLGRASLVVVPSLWEAFSMVRLEALATGTPIVTAKESRFDDLIDPLVGRSFEPGAPHQGEPSNLEGLVRALLETLELSRCAETPARCRSLAERFDWSVLGSRFEEVYRRVLRRKTHPIDAGKH